MNEMVERVALEMQKELGPRMQNQSDAWQHTAFRYTARLVIAAMREPTGAMADAALEEHPFGTDTYFRYWQAMIDEALKE
jgi:hypothetical protein